MTSHASRLIFIITHLPPPAPYLRRTISSRSTAFSHTFPLLHNLQQVANLLLLIQCVLTMYIQWSLEEKLDRLAPSLIFSLLLCCRYFVHFQATEKERRVTQARKAEWPHMRGCVEGKTTPPNASDGLCPSVSVPVYFLIDKIELISRVVALLCQKYPLLLFTPEAIISPASSQAAATSLCKLMRG